MCARRRRRQSSRSEPPRRPAWDEVHPTLDLHGETGDSARKRAERWLRDRQREGTRVVRIVTGRGLHSVGPPVLPGEIGDLLRALRGSVVAGFEKEIGGGAFVVEMRRPSAPVAANRPAAPAAATTREDARLLRLAEESLVELGISPTPELIAAEMERLAREG